MKVTKQMVSATENSLRQNIIDGCLAMNAQGYNHGTSGNISHRLDGRMLITPTSTPYDDLKPELIASLALDKNDTIWDGPLAPSSEWRMHRDIMLARPEINAIVHLHSAFATVLSAKRITIPAAHYQIAQFGGDDIRCAEYAQYGTQALSDNALAALDNRTGCLLANHGMLAIGDSLEKALWLAVELEAQAHCYFHTLQIGGPILLTKEQIAPPPGANSNYGLRSS